MELKICVCGRKPRIIINNPSNYMVICRCGRRTNGCNDEEHAIFCWNSGFVYKQNEDLRRS